VNHTAEGTTFEVLATTGLETVIKQRRFNDFYKLRSQMHKNEVRGLDFPPKELFLSDTALEKRRELLQSFMNGVILQLENKESRRLYRQFFTQDSNQTGGAPELIAVNNFTTSGLHHGAREDKRLRQQAQLDKQRKTLVQKKRQQKTRENLGEGIKPTGLDSARQKERHRRAHEKKQRQQTEQQQALLGQQQLEEEAETTAATSRKAANDFHRTSYAPRDTFSSDSSEYSSSEYSSTGSRESYGKKENRNPQGLEDGGVPADEQLLRRWEAQKTLHSLLISLHHILPDRCKKFPNLRPESQSEELRKCYKKALRCVHPDKLGGVDEVTARRCRRVFVRLTAAHEAYADAASVI
jgi:hypothetical protein